MPLRVIEYRQLLQIITMFLIVQFGGLLLATRIYSGLTCQAIASTQVVASGPGLLFYIIMVVAFALVLLAITKFFKGARIFVFIEGVVIFLTSYYFFGILASIPTGSISAFIFGNPGTAPITVYIVAVSLALLLVVAKNLRPYLRNSAAIIASIGTGVILGIGFGFIIALAFMAILAVYDFIAVFITKHMIALANTAMNLNLAFMVSVDETKAVPQASLSAKQVAEYRKDKAQVLRERHRLSPVVEQLEHSSLIPVSARAALGTGDLAIPLMLAVSAYKFRLDFVLSSFIILGALLGLVITMLILRKYKRALPAIPPLLFGIAIALGIYVLIFGFHAIALPASALCSAA